MSDQENITIMPQLVMLRPDLDELPPLELPAGFKLRTEAAGDDKAWEDIVQASFGWGEVSYDMMRDDPAYSPKRVIFIANEQGQAVATAAAWFSQDYPADCAVLHMVGILPDYSGLHLGLMASLAAMQQARELGYKRIALKTDDFRIPAVKIYLRLGYFPRLVDSSHLERWQAVLEKINRQDLIPLLAQPYDGKTLKEI